MTVIRPEHRAEARAAEDVRAFDIVMALGGCWVLLGVILYMAVAS